MGSCIIHRERTIAMFYSNTPIAGTVNYGIGHNFTECNICGHLAYYKTESTLREPVQESEDRPRISPQGLQNAIRGLKKQTKETKEEIELLYKLERNNYRVRN